jgi:hypothetical protein
MIYACKNLKHLKQCTYPSVIGEAESCWLLSIVKPVVFVAHQPQVIRSVEIASDLYRVPRGNNLLMTNRGSAGVVIIWSLEIGILIRGLAAQEKPLWIPFT